MGKSEETNKEKKQKVVMVRFFLINVLIFSYKHLQYRAKLFRF